MDRKDRDIAISQIAEAFKEAWQTGKKPSLDDYVKAHPELGEELRRHLETETLLLKYLTPEPTPPKVEERIWRGVAETLYKRSGVYPFRRRDVFLLVLGLWDKLRAKVQGLTKPFRSSTRFMKLLWLLKAETGIENEVDEFYRFAPGKLGPLSADFYPECNWLIEMGLVRVSPRPPKQASTQARAFKETSSDRTQYALTSDGAEQFEMLWNLARERLPKLIDKISSVIEQYGAMDLGELLKCIYQKYPESSRASEIKGEILEDE